MTKKLKEGLAEFAASVDKDHEIHMAQADLYKIAKYSIKLHELLKNITEEEGIEAWQQAKITKAADYISSVYHSLDYDLKIDNCEPEEIAAESINIKKIIKSTNESNDPYKSILHSKLNKIIS